MKKSKIILLLALTLAVIFAASAGSISYADDSAKGEYDISFYSGESDFSILMDFEGNLYSTGANGVGQLGRGYKSAAILFEPLKVKILDGVKTFDTGRAGFVIALKNNGEVYAWGQNQFSQLAQGADIFNDDTETNCITRAQKVEFLDSAEIIDVQAGYRHSMFLDANGRVYTAGSNGFAQLGLNMEVSRRIVKGTPTMIPQGNFDGQKIIGIATNEFTSFALTKNGDVYAWGDNDFGQIGNGDNETANKFYPAPVKTLLSNVKKISAEGNSAMAITNDNRVFIWGKNSNGEFGVPSFTKTFSSVPVEITEVFDLDGNRITVGFKDILCGGIANFILDENQSVYSFGVGGNGELGYNTHDYNSNPYIDTGNAKAPLKIQFYAPHNIYEITNGSDDSLKGKLPVDRTKPIDVKIEALINSIALRTFVADSNGNVWSWGDNANGIACSGDQNKCIVPVRSTLFRDSNYDKTIQQKNYAIKPAIGLSIIAGLAILFFGYSEIKIQRQKKLK